MIPELAVIVCCPVLSRKQKLDDARWLDVALRHGRGVPQPARPASGREETPRAYRLTTLDTRCARGSRRPGRAVMGSLG